MQSKNVEDKKVSNQATRRALSEWFVLDSEFEAFVQDCWPEVKWGFSSGMDRISRESRLLEKIPAGQVLRVAHEYSSGNKSRIVEEEAQATPERPVAIRSAFTKESARLWIIKSCLLLLLSSVLFFLLAPFVGYPIESELATHVLQILVPIFLGYVGQSLYLATRHRQGGADRKIEPISRTLDLFVKWPISVFGLSFLALVIVFGISNRAGAEIGIGMTPNGFLIGISALAAGLTMSTNILILYLFGD